MDKQILQTDDEKTRHSRPECGSAHAEGFVICRDSGGRRISRRTNGQGGFSIVEVAIVVVIFLLIAAIAIPQAVKTLRAFRASSDARNIATQLALVKMRAANSFTQARLNCDTTANSCRVEICTSKGTSTCNTFTAEGGPVTLSTGMSFGFGSITTAAGTQTTIQNTAQILFNSRSLPVDSTGAPTGNYALYLTDQSGNTYAVTVYASGRIAVWRYGDGAWNIQ
jgi:Tfp pilus assembly protein FimT